MEPYVFVTKDGGIGFNHYGTCVVMPIKKWVELATQAQLHDQEMRETVNHLLSFVSIEYPVESFEYDEMAGPVNVGSFDNPIRLNTRGEVRVHNETLAMIKKKLDSLTTNSGEKKSLTSKETA